MFPRVLQLLLNLLGQARRQGFPRQGLRIHNLLGWRLSWGLQAVFGNVFRGCTMHLPLVVSPGFVCWSSAVYQWFVRQKKHSNFLCWPQNTPLHLPEICKGRLNFQKMTPLPSWAAPLQCRQAWPPEGAAPQLTLAGKLVLRGGWGYSSEERYFDGICVVTII